MREGFPTPRIFRISSINARRIPNPEDLPNLINKCEKDSLVIGSRYIKGGSILGWDPYRKTVSRSANLLARVFAYIRVKDATSGYRCYGLNVVKAILPNLDSNGYEIQIEILGEAAQLDFNISEMPIEFKNRTTGKSKLTFVHILGFIKQTFLLFCKYKECNRIMKFSLVGFSGAIITEGLLFFLTEILHIFYIFSAVLSIESAILNNFVWNEIWTFKDRAHGTLMDSFHRLVKFNITRILGMVINIILLALLTEVFGIYYLLSNLAAVIIVFVMNYLFSIKYIW